MNMIKITLSIRSFSMHPVDCEHETDEKTSLNSFRYNAALSVFARMICSEHAQNSAMNYAEKCVERNNYGSQWPRGKG